jgi:hypothetical protein
MAEASDEASRKFAWIAAGLLIACAILAYVSISTYFAYASACAYINVHAPVEVVEHTEEADFAKALLRNHCR